MVPILLGLLAIACSVFLSEYLSRKKLLGKETSRKVPHMITGLVIAVVAYFIELETIRVLLLADILVILAVYKFNLFSSARDVDRLSWGELFFPIGLIVAAFISTSKWVFIAAVLVLGFSDAIAALVGLKAGKHKYTTFGHTKSYEGSAVFFLTALLIISWVTFIAPSGLQEFWLPVVLLSFSATLVEGITPWGMDNMLIPILVVSGLNPLA